MKKSIKELIDMFFGKQTKDRFFRLVMLILVISLIIMLTLNISYSKKDGFCWGPAAKININR